MISVSSVSADYDLQGFCAYPGFLAADDFAPLEDTLRGLIITASKKLQPEAREVFEAAAFDNESILHQGLILLHELSPRLEQFVVDGICNSRSLYHFVSLEKLCRLASLHAQCDLKDLSMNDAFMRVDLPDRFEEHIRRISLPFHQDSSYYPYNVSHSTGLVMWIPLFDCGPQEGSMEVCLGSHKSGVLSHEAYYEVPEKNLHYRTRVSAETVNQFEKAFLETKRGTAVMQHFNLIHRSGSNQVQDRVRYTVLARVSNLTAPDFIPVSWR